MTPLSTAGRDRALAELALRQLRRAHPDKWRGAVAGDSALAGWFEDQIRDVCLRRPDPFEVVGAVVALAIMDERKNPSPARERGRGEGLEELRS